MTGLIRPVQPGTFPQSADRTLKLELHGVGMCTYHPKAQRGQHHDKSQAGTSCGPGVGLGKTRGQVCSASPREAEEQAGQSPCPGTGGRCPGGEKLPPACDASMGSQQQDPRQLSGEN